jgi:UDP-2,4-diacetamido-2,4,6-trideoxy-beta-L-altropyranose hydrolase
MLAAKLDALAGDPARRQAMTVGAQTLVDGGGALRVVTRLWSELLALRPAELDDARLLWDWVNDPDVRGRAFSTDVIPWETHSRWLADRVADPLSHIWIASAPNGDAVGQVRFETRGGSTEVAISVAGRARGKGWGGALIDAGVRRLFVETDVESVLARVKPDNIASLRAFDSAAFIFDGQGSDGSNTWVRYARSRDASGR